MRISLPVNQVVRLGALAALLAVSAALWADAGDYAAIDRHARAAPPEVERSVTALARYLTEPTQDDSSRARAIFTWIATNISYDVSRLGKMPDANSVVRDRRAVCAGYAVLFNALAEAAGLEAVIIYGEARGRGPAAARTSDGLFNHDWNAVKIGGEWRLVDCAWGAGQLDERGRFRPRFRDHYFLAPPELLIYDHLPKDQKWQLLPRPLSRQEFLRQVEVHPAFFDYQIRLLSHTQGRIEAGCRVSISLGAPPGVNLMASLHHGNIELAEGYTFAQRSEGGYQIQAVFPKAGNYVVKVHARRQDSEEQGYDCALEYRVHATAADASTFPKMYLSFQEENCLLGEPLSSTLPAHRPVRFSLTAPEAEEVLVFCDGSAARLAHQDNGAFSGSVTLEPGEAIVFAKYPGQTKHLALLKYRVE
jgi:transglutaminase/protease-like cytokinesis protein 3